MKSSVESENRVLSLRRKAGLTQKELAERASTSQQQVARIERGVQRASLDLAVRLCKALNAPLEKVFPLSKKAVRAMSKMEQRAVGDDMLNGGKLTDAMAEAGIELDSRRWLIRLRFTNGAERTFEVSASEQHRMRDAMFRSEMFLVFDSEDARLAVNLRHIEYAHWLFEVPSNHVSKATGEAEGDATQGEPDPTEEVIVILASDREPLRFAVDEDVPDDPEEGAETGQMRHLLYMAEHQEDGDPYRFHFEDEDGEEVFLLPSAVSMISIPLWVVEPALFDARMEAFEEEVPLPEAGHNLESCSLLD